MYTDAVDNKPRMAYFGEKKLVSGGQVGCPGDLVVDNADDPEFILGEIQDNRSIRAFNSCIFSRIQDGQV